MTTNSDQQTRSVKLSETLVSRVEDRLPRTKWETPEEYISHVLTEVLYRVETESKDDEFNSTDEEEVRQRLKSLGYLEE